MGGDCHRVFDLCASCPRRRPRRHAGDLRPRRERPRYHSMMRALLVLSLLLGCGGTTRGTTPGLSKDDAVFEAVFLHEIAGASVAADETVCLAIRGSTNDGSALLAAIKSRHPTA